MLDPLNLPTQLKKALEQTANKRESTTMIYSRWFARIGG